MQSFAAIISDARFAVTTEISEITKLMIGVKVAASPFNLSPSLTEICQVWLFGSAVCDVVITTAMVVIVSLSIQTAQAFNSLYM